MGLSKLSEKCRVCPKVDTCNNKRMEALAFMDGPCEREQAAAVVASSDPASVAIQTAPDFEAFTEEVNKLLAKAFQIPEYIMCKHIAER